MGLDMGIAMDMTTEELERVIEICKHSVGLDYKRPYHRHGKAFYRAYRNYYADVPEGNRLLDKLPECLFTVHRDAHGATYHLTKTGLEWLGRQLQISECDGCKWNGKRHQKCSCCRRNRNMKDNYKEEER